MKSSTCEVYTHSQWSVIEIPPNSCRANGKERSSMRQGGHWQSATERAAAAHRYCVSSGRAAEQPGSSSNGRPTVLLSLRSCSRYSISGEAPDTARFGPNVKRYLSTKQLRTSIILGSHQARVGLNPRTRSPATL